MEVSGFLDLVRRTDLMGILTSRLLLGTTPLMKVQWESEAQKKREGYYVSRTFGTSPRPLMAFQ